MDKAVHWEDLPDGTFAECGTNVSTAIVVIDKDDDEPAPFLVVQRQPAHQPRLFD